MNTNYVRLIGHLGSHLKVINTKTGKMARIRLATTYKLKKPDSDGNTYGTVWHDVIAYGQKATYAESNLVKGSRVLVEGIISYRSYLDNSQHRRYVTEIIVQGLLNLDR